LRRACSARSRQQADELTGPELVGLAVHLRRGERWLHLASRERVIPFDLLALRRLQIMAATQMVKASTFITSVPAAQVARRSMCAHLSASPKRRRSLERNVGRGTMLTRTAKSLLDGGPTSASTFHRGGEGVDPRLALSIAASRAVSCTGFARKATAPAASHLFRTPASSCAVMMMVGITMPSRLRLC